MSRALARALVHFRERYGTRSNRCERFSYAGVFADLVERRDRLDAQHRPARVRPTA